MADRYAMELKIGAGGMAARSYRRALALNRDKSVAEETLDALEKRGVRAGDEDEDEDG